MASEIFDSEARLSWVLAVLAGVLGATSFTHSAGYFVIFMTGNAQRAVLGYFRHDVVCRSRRGCYMLASSPASWLPHGAGDISGWRIRTARPC